MAVVGAFIAGAFSFGAGAAFTAGAATFGAWTAGAAFASTIVGSLAVKLLTTVASSALVSALSHEPPQGGGITITTTVRGEQNPETIILGRYCTAGQAISPPMSAGGSHKHMHHIVELCSAPGAQLSRLMINDDWVDLGPLDSNGFLPVLGDYEGLIWLKYFDGTQTSTDAYMLDRYGADPDRPWTADMIGTGICYAIIGFKFDEDEQTSVPRYRFELQGIPLYDIRKDSTVGGSGSQRLADPSTWAPTDNPVVMIWNIMRGIRLPGGEIYGGNITDLSELPQSMWITAMNRCDTPIEVASGSEPQYRAGLEIALDQPPAAAIEELLKACSGTTADLGYGWGITVGAPALPVYSFTDDDLIVSKPQELDPFPGIDSTYNAVSARYPDPDELYETKEAPKRTNAAWEAADAFGRKTANLSLPAAPYKRQVQRLMRAWIEDERRFRRHNVSLPPDAAMVELTDTISWTSTRNGYASKSFSVHKIAEDPRTGIRTMSIREREPGDYAWVPGDELPSNPVTPGTTPGGPVTVSGFAVSAITIDDAGGVPRRAGILLSWDQELMGGGIQWQARLAGQAALALNGATLDVAAGELRLYEGVLPATAYQLRARLMGRKSSTWTVWLPVTTPNVRIAPAEIDDTPPPVPTGLVLSSTPGVLAADWDASPATDLATYDIELTEAGTNPVVFTTPQNGHRWSPVQPNRSFSARVRAVDRLGNRSGWSASVAHTSARDTTPPAVPTGITIAAGFGTFWLKWNSNTESDLAYYEIYQSTSMTAPVAGTAATYRTTSNTTTVTGLADATTRHFWIRAVDSSENRSAWSARFSGTTTSIWQPPGIPAVPVGLAAATRMNAGWSYVSASWTSAADAVSYELGITENSQSEIVTAIGEARFEWQALPNTAFAIRVRAIGPTGLKSAWSAVVSQTSARDQTAPAVPSTVAITGTFGGLWVKWDRNTEADLACYEVLWNASSSWTPPANPSTTPTQISANQLLITGLGAAETRYVAVRAVDTSGNKSAWTAPAPGTALADVDVAITNADLQGLVDATSFATGIQPVTIHAGASLPTTKSTDTLVWGGKLYRWVAAPATGSPRYMANVDAADILGQLAAGQLGIDSVTTGTVAAAAINTRELAAYAATASRLAIGDFTNLIPGSELTDPASWTLPATISIDAAQKQLVFAASATNRVAQSTLFPVDPGAEYFFSIALSTTDAGATGNFRLQLRWFDRAGAAISWTPNNDAAIPANATATIERSAAAPATAAYGRYYAQALASAAGQITATRPLVRQKGTGKLFVDGTLKSNHFVTDEAIITGSAQIAMAIINSGHVIELSAAKLTAGTALTSSITVDGTALATVATNAATGAQDPTIRINAGTTTIDPGKILISGTTRLSDWRNGADNTKIEGGSLATNTVSANKLNIGLRGLNLLSTRFEVTNPASHQIAWSAGQISYTNNAGTNATVSIAAGTGSLTAAQVTAGNSLYVYWVQGAAALSTTTTLNTAKGANNVILATYKGGLALNPDFGRTVIDGSEIRTGSIRGAQLITTEELITEAAQIRAATITNGHVVELDAAKLISGSQLSSSITVDGRALDVLGGDMLLDTMEQPWTKFQGAGTIAQITSTETGITGNKLMRGDPNGSAFVVSPNRMRFDPTKLYKVSYTVRKMANFGAKTKGQFVTGLRCYGGDDVAVAASWVNFVEQSAISGTLYETYAFYVRGVSATPGGAGTIANPRSLIDTTRYIRPACVFNYVVNTLDGDYQMVVNTAIIAVVDEDAGDVINAGSTQIDPGKVRISGGATLADWRRGGDETRIDGGALSANTVAANKLEIGSRNVTLTGIQFEHNSPTANRVSWTAGAIRWINDAGVNVSTAIPAGNAAWTTGVLYVYWTKGAASFSTTTAQATAFDTNNLILATYQGGKLLDPDYGRTIIDGSDIKTGTIGADQLRTNTAIITGTAQIGDAVVTSVKIGGRALYIPYFTTRADVTVPVTNLRSSPMLLIDRTIGDFEGGGFMVAFNAIMDCSDKKDTFGSVYLVIDGTEAARSRFGVRTSGADTEFIMPIVLMGSANGEGTTNLKVYAYCSHWDNDTTASGPFVLRNMKLTLSGTRR